MGKSYFLATYGCQMNEYDGEVIEAFLDSRAMVRTSDPKEADVIFFNTCCVRDNADQKVYGRLGEFKPLRERNPRMRIIVAGCLAQKDGQELARRFPHIDLVMGTRDIHRLPNLFDSMDGASETIVAVEGTGDEIGMPVKRASTFCAWVPVSLGCDCFCTFCIVPHVRGRHRSRHPLSIISEVESLAREGCIQICLLGQNVNAYGKDLDPPLTFADLLERADAVKGIERIRYTSPHPRDFNEDFILRTSLLEKLCDHVHLPLQSGSNTVLKRMSRGYTREDFRAVVDSLRRHIPGISITTDIIVGFPGETRDQFEETLDLVREIRFDNAFMFAYSTRAGTAAAMMKEQLDEQEKLERLHELISTQNRITQEVNRSLEGSVREILIECTSRKNACVLTGRTRDNRVVNVSGGADLIGRLVPAVLTRAYTWGFQGELA